MLGQHHHESILRSHLEKMGTVVEFESELRGFERDRQESTHTQARNDDVSVPSNCMPELATEGILTLRSICRLGASRVWVLLG